MDYLHCNSISFPARKNMSSGSSRNNCLRQDKNEHLVCHGNELHAIAFDGANENAYLKNDINFIVVPFIYARQKCLLTTGHPKRISIEVFATFLISYSFETTA